MLRVIEYFAKPLKVTQGHSKWHPWVRHVQVLVSIPLKLCLYLVPFLGFIQPEVIVWPGLQFIKYNMWWSGGRTRGILDFQGGIFLCLKKPLLHCTRDRNAIAIYKPYWEWINPLIATLKPHSTDHHIAIQWLVNWPLVNGLLHLVQRWEDWAGLQPAQAPPRCTKCNRSTATHQPTSYYSM